jgi:uncharacterized phage protein (TIGR01671 family)
MRQLKFRVWDSVLKQWRNSTQLVLRPDGKVTDGSILIEEPVQQWTGLKDRDGKEIYEGDIIRHEYPEQPRYSRKGYENPNLPDNMSVIRWTREGEDNHPGFRVYDLNGQGGKIEVIGNIFEHSELLKQ